MQENKILSKIPRISKKYSFSIISFICVFISIPLVLKYEEVRQLGAMYAAGLTALVIISILLIAVSYLTGQAKIDLEATFGKDEDSGS